MDLASVWYLGVTLILFGLFVVILARTYRRDRKEEKEAPKYRMMDED